MHDGRLVVRPVDFIEQLMTRVLQTGLPVWRTYIGLQLVHPQLQAMAYVWRRGEKGQALPRA